MDILTTYSAVRNNYFVISLREGLEAHYLKNKQTKTTDHGCAKWQFCSDRHYVSKDLLAHLCQNLQPSVILSLAPSYPETAKYEK